MATLLNTQGEQSPGGEKGCHRTVEKSRSEPGSLGTTVLGLIPGVSSPEEPRGKLYSPVVSYCSMFRVIILAKFKLSSMETDRKIKNT